MSKNKLTKYAMVTINKKNDLDGMHVRRVLVSYKFKLKKKVNGIKVDFLYGTKFITGDSYFVNENATHHYKFEDKGYTLYGVSNYYQIVEYANNAPVVFSKRRYHMYPQFSRLVNENYPKDDAYFTASSDSEAMKIFRNRKELR